MKTKGCRSRDRDQARLLEEVGDLVMHRRAEDGADAEDDLLQLRLLARYSASISSTRRLCQE
jgi:hypothetical protein